MSRKGVSLQIEDVADGSRWKQMVAEGGMADVAERAACGLVGVRSGSIASHASL